MNRFAVVILAGLALVTTGCAAMSTRAPVTGLLYTGTKSGETATTNHASSKEGRACAQSILGLVGTGDASINTAAANGGITRISYVDSESTSILGLYATYCSVVRGE